MKVSVDDIFEYDVDYLPIYLSKGDNLRLQSFGSRSV